MGKTAGHGKRTRRRTEAWSRRASFAGIVGWWLNKLAKRLTHRAERREAKRLARLERAGKEEG